MRLKGVSALEDDYMSYQRSFHAGRSWVIIGGKRGAMMLGAGPR